MSRVITGAFLAELVKTSTRIARLWLLKRPDETKYYFTGYDRPITFDPGDGGGDQVFESMHGFRMSAIESSSTMAVDNATLVAFFNSPGGNGAEEDDIRAGLFDGSEIFLFIVIPTNLAAGSLKLHRGNVGNVRLSDKGIFESEFRGMIQRYRQTIGELYGPVCRDNVGGPRCRIPIMPPAVEADTVYSLPYDPGAMNPLEDGRSLGPSFVLEDIGGTDGIPNYEDVVYEVTVAGTTGGVTTRPVFDSTPGNTTVWGGVTFTAREGWLRAVTVGAVNPSQVNKEFTVGELTPEGGGSTPGRDYFPDDSMNGGGVLWVSGNNAGVVDEIRNFEVHDTTASEQTITLFEGLPFAIEVGDKALVWRGCDGTMATCAAVFANAVNQRAEKYIPGQDFLLTIPDARY